MQHEIKFTDTVGCSECPVNKLCREIANCQIGNEACRNLVDFSADCFAQGAVAQHQKVMNALLDSPVQDNESLSLVNKINSLKNYYHIYRTDSPYGLFQSKLGTACMHAVKEETTYGLASTSVNNLLPDIKNPISEGAQL
jgi:hypothetical protein